MKHKFAPVIHVKTLDQARLNVKIAIDSGADGVFLINHQISGNKLVSITNTIREEFPRIYLGVNILDKDPIKFIEKLPLINALWLDSMNLNEDANLQPETLKIVMALLKNPSSNIKFFGSVAFKYQPQPKNLNRFIELAVEYANVLVTSGDATGEAASINKIIEIHKYINETFIGGKLALASGVHALNVESYKPYVEWFLVASSISKDFYNLDPIKTKELADLIHK